MVERVWVGVDVGEAGGIAVDDGVNVHVFEMPTMVRGEIDGAAFRRILAGLNAYPKESVTVVLERLNGFGSPQSGFALGRASGIVEGIFQSFRFDDLRFIDSVTWKSKLGLRGRGKTKEISKKLGIDLARRLYPGVQVKHDGIADALLLAHYAKEYREKVVDDVFESMNQGVARVLN